MIPVHICGDVLDRVGHAQREGERIETEGGRDREGDLLADVMISKSFSWHIGVANTKGQKSFKIESKQPLHSGHDSLV